MSASVLYSRYLGVGKSEEGRHKINQINTLVFVSSVIIVALGLLNTFFISSDHFSFEQDKFAIAIIFIRINYIVVFLTIVFDYFVYLFKVYFQSQFEYVELIDNAIYAVCIMAFVFPLRFVNTTISNILTCVKQNTLVAVTVMIELLILPSLFFAVAIVLDANEVLWWSFLLSEIVTILMYVVISFFYRRRKNIKSWLFYPDFPSEYKNSFYILLKPEQLNDLELNQKMAAMFLDYNEVGEEDKIRAVQNSVN